MIPRADKQSLLRANPKDSHVYKVFGTSLFWPCPARLGGQSFPSPQLLKHYLYNETLIRGALYGKLARTMVRTERF